MRKAAYFIALFAIACLFAGTYGALHNQISYTVSDEYFTKLKFAQFHIPETHQNRIGVSMVGWCASWWMGIVIGAILIPLGLVIPTAKRYFISMTKVIAIVCLTALIFACAALVHGYASFDANDLPSYRYPPNLQNKLAFARAAHMHNASYLGAFAGLATGGAAIFLLRRKARKSLQQSLSHSGSTELKQDASDKAKVERARDNARDILEQAHTECSPPFSSDEHYKFCMLKMQAAMVQFEVCCDVVACYETYPDSFARRIVLKNFLHKILEYKTTLQQHHIKWLRDLADSKSLAQEKARLKELSRQYREVLKRIDQYRPLRNAASGHYDPDVQKQVNWITSIDEDGAWRLIYDFLVYHKEVVRILRDIGAKWSTPLEKQK